MITDMVSARRNAASLPRSECYFGAGKKRQHIIDIPQVQATHSLRVGRDSRASDVVSVVIGAAVLNGDLVD
jgi:hypothetical protein